MMELTRHAGAAGNGRALLLAVLVAASVAAAGAAAPPVQSWPYLAYRAAHAVWMRQPAPGFRALESAHFIVQYKPADAPYAQPVAEATEAAYARVDRAIGLPRRGRIALVVHPDQQSLLRAFGWEERSAVGVYWAGAIHLLTPRAWDGGGDPRATLKGVLVHELTHLAIDYRTSGNYPRWFTEGVAQWMEEQATGYRWVAPESGLSVPPYGLRELDGSFDALPNQALAYRQALSMVAFLTREYGWEAIARALDGLGRGRSIDAAVADATGLPYDRFYDRWLAWRADRPELW